MIKQKIHVIIFFISTTIHFYTLDAQRACVIKPVIDLVGQPFASNVKHYTQMPIAATNNKCLRIHQLLYNDVVEVTRQLNNQCCITVSDLFYVTTSNRQPQYTFWTHKDNLLFLKDLAPEHHQYIPHPTQNNAIITLKMPWYSKKLNCTFSAGTRFVRTRAKLRPRHTQVYAVEPDTHNIAKLYVPTSSCASSNQMNIDTQLALYRETLAAWARMPGVIPYVWGGCSLVHTQNNDRFHTQPIEGDAKSVAYIYPNNKNPKSGFDCAGLITRAARVAGLPYRYKNTTTLAHYLSPIHKYEQLENGDLIWIPGHVMAISNKEKGRIIEARHYSHGYGKVQELPLEEIFKDINSIQELCNQIEKDATLERLNRDGKVVQQIKQAKLLSMRSCIQPSPNNRLATNN